MHEYWKYKKVPSLYARGAKKLFLCFLLIVFFLLSFHHTLVSYADSEPGDAILEAEYFLDQDPGEGNGTPLPPKDGAFGNLLENVEFVINTESLSVGRHQVFVRMKNNNGVWGLARKIPFEVQGNNHIVRAEYYIDSDPGIGQGIAIEAFDGLFDQSIEKLTSFYMDTSGLSLGMHRLLMRAMDSNGDWGITTQVAFEVSPRLYITGARYYVDCDPNTCSGQLMSAEDGQFDEDTESVTSGEIACSDFTSGTHDIYLKMVDSYGHWSPTEKYRFFAPLDNNIPAVVINVPSDGQNFNTQNITIHGTATDLSGIEKVLVNGLIADGLSDWSKEITLEEGENTVTVIAFDNSPNHNTATATVNVTYHSPSQQICGDADNNGSVDIFDALLIAEFDVGLKNQSEVPGFSVCDVDNNGHVDIYDALAIAEYDVTLRENLNCQ